MPRRASRALAYPSSHMPTVRDQAVCIRIWDWSETSQTVSIFARELGILRGVAKGAKREGSPFSGGLEAMTRGEVVAIVKSNERSPDTLATLTAWDLQETFPAVRRSLSAFHSGLYMLDLVHHAVRDADPHAGLFDGLVLSLRRLERAGDEPLTLAWFQWLALKECGFTPELGMDVRTRGPLAIAPSYGFSASLGGFLADPEGRGRAEAEASDPGSHAVTGNVWRVRAATIDLLRALDRSCASQPEPTESPGAAVGSEISDAVVSRANRLLAMYFQTILGRWPPSVHAVFPGIAGGQSRGGV